MAKTEVELELEDLEDSLLQVTHSSQLRPIVSSLIRQVKKLAAVEHKEGVLLEAEPDPRLDEFKTQLDELKAAIEGLAGRVEAVEENVTFPGEPAIPDEEKKATKALKKARHQ